MVIFLFFDLAFRWRIMFLFLLFCIIFWVMIGSLAEINLVVDVALVKHVTSPPVELPY